MAYSGIPEWFRNVAKLDQNVSGVPAGTPEPFMPDNGDNELLCIWTGQEILRLMSSIMFGANLLYPDDRHTVYWSFLRQLEFPNEIPGGGTVDVVTFRNVKPEDTDGGPLAVGNNIVPIWRERVRDDVGIIYDTTDGEWGSIPPGNWHIEIQQVVRNASTPRYQLGFNYWAVGSPNEWVWGELVQGTAYLGVELLRCVFDIEVSVAVQVDVYVWTDTANANTTAMGDGRPGRESNFGTITMWRNGP